MLAQYLVSIYALQVMKIVLEILSQTHKIESRERERERVLSGFKKEIYEIRICKI